MPPPFCTSSLFSHTLSLFFHWPCWLSAFLPALLFIERKWSSLASAQLACYRLLLHETATVRNKGGQCSRCEWARGGHQVDCWDTWCSSPSAGCHFSGVSPWLETLVLQSVKVGVEEAVSATVTGKPANIWIWHVYQNSLCCPCYGKHGWDLQVCKCPLKS